ncbi:MAG TPA: FMN-binding protein [Ktedonobacterales bacterium]|nr:FMN-binding protein [Ktedonobacterales bacterium]
MQAQSAQVDIVTGATDSSFAFMQSLTDALSQAQA